MAADTEEDSNASLRSFFSVGKKPSMPRQVDLRIFDTTKELLENKRSMERDNIKKVRVLSSLQTYKEVGSGG